MEVLNAMQNRRSIRKFKPDPVPEASITALLESARLAPSGSNLQPSRFVVIKDPQVREKLNTVTPLPFVSKAPVVLACCVDSQVFAAAGKRVQELKEANAFVDTPLADVSPEDYQKRRKLDEATARAYLGLNAAIAIDHITLRAVDLGLGTCWVMMFDQEKTKEILELDERYSVIALLPVGYPDQAPQARPRIALEDILIKEM